MAWTDDQIKGKLLHKLVRSGKFEHSHTAIEYLQKGFPKDLVGRVKDMITELKKEGILKSKQTSYGEQVSVNVEKTEQIMTYVDVFMRNT